MDNRKLYKYLKREFAESLTTKGIIKIGTLYDFRQMEDIQRGDKNEGKKNTIHVIDKPTVITDMKQIPGDFHKALSLKNGEIHYGGNNKLTLREETGDRYLLCCSMKQSAELMGEFEGADTCVEIFDIQKFGDVIFNHLVEAGYIFPWCVGNMCQYIGHDVGHTFNEPGYWLKDKFFEAQEEFRYMYVPLVRDTNGLPLPHREYEENGINKFEVENPNKVLYPPIQPLIIECPEITKYCRIKEL